MKTLKITFMLAVMLIFSVIVSANETTLVGTRLTTDLHSAYVNFSCNEPDAVWSPDGKYIAYRGSIGVPITNKNTILLASISGGTPEVIYEQQPFICDGIRFYFGGWIECFSADGSEILFYENVYDIDRGTVVNFISRDGINSYSVQISGEIPTLKAVNIYTKVVRTIAEQVSMSSVNCTKDGKYILFKVNAKNSWGYRERSLVSLNNETGETNLVLSSQGLSIGAYDITPDDKNILFKSNLTSIMFALYEVPIEGGTPTRIATNLPGGTDTNLSLSSNGEWALFQSNTSVIDTLASSGQEHRITHYTIYAYNLNNGNLVDIFDNINIELPSLNIADGSPINFQNPLWSPDGLNFFCNLSFIATDTNTSKTYVIDDVFVFDFDVNEYLKAVGEVAVETESVPDAFTIKGNYPNPFNPSTTIEFTLGKAEKTSLVIYNLAGQRVRELMEDTILTPGIHSILWNGKDDSGKTVSSGIYFARLLSGEKSSVKSMMFVK